MSLIEKIAHDRTTAFNLGTEHYVRTCPVAEREDMRTIIKEASHLLSGINQTLSSGDTRKIRQLKTAFANHGITVAENNMTTEAIKEAAKSGLTAVKIATDRQNAFEIGTEVFIEKVGMDESTAENFRGVMAQGLQELANNPEAVQQELAK